MMQRLWIPGKMPNTNDIVSASGKHGAGSRFKTKRWNRYSEMKRLWSEEIRIHALQRRLRPITETCWTFMFAEGNRFRDPDNFVAGGWKIIFDALQDCGLLRGDGWKHVTDLKPYWTVDQEDPGVFVVISKEVICPRWEDAFTLYEEYKAEQQHG